MVGAFHQILSGLRKGKRVSQRKVAADLYISQALLSHYENGIREPGLDFVNRACDYYGVTADYLLGRTEEGAVSPEMQLLADLSHASSDALTLSVQLTERLTAIEAQIVQHMQQEKENPNP